MSDVSVSQSQQDTSPGKVGKVENLFFLYSILLFVFGLLLHGWVKYSEYVWVYMERAM